MNKDSNHPGLKVCLTLIILSSVLSALFSYLTTSLRPGIDLLLGELFFVLPVIIYLRIRKHDIKTTFRANRVGNRIVGVSVLLGISFTVLVDELDRIIATFIEVPPEWHELLSRVFTIDSFSDAIILFTAVVLFASVFEEMVFRGMLQQAFEQRVVPPKALFSTALVFAFMHLFSPWTIQILILGLILGYLAWRSNSIIPGIILHCFNNSFALLFLNIQPESMQWYNWNGHVYPPILVIASGVAFYGLKWFHRHTEVET